MNANIVIIAGDDSDDRFLMREALKIVAAIHSVIEVSDGRELMNLLREPGIKPELLVVDVNMPPAGDLEILQQLMAFDLLVDVPKVAISGDKHRLDDAVCVGADAFYSKPATLEGYLEIARDIKRHYLG